MGASGILISKVIRVKKGKKKDFLIVDAGMNNLLRPSLYNSKHSIFPVKTGDKKIISGAFKLYNKHENPEDPSGPLIKSEGLTTRRTNEKNLFNTPYVIDKPKSKYDEFMTDED